MRFWERLNLSAYRVAAVAVAALATAIGLGALTHTKWWKHAPLAMATWALIGKLEGDAAVQERTADVGRSCEPTARCEAATHGGGGQLSDGCVTPVSLSSPRVGDAAAGDG